MDLHGNTGFAAFAVATSNIGAGGNIQVTVNKGSLPVNVALCQTGGRSAACVNPPAPSVSVSIAQGATPTFAFFVQGQGFIPFDPANNRLSPVFTNSATGNVGRPNECCRAQP